MSPHAVSSKNSGRIAAATTLAGWAVPASMRPTKHIQGPVGCGGRGTGATVNALSVKQGPLKLVAAADVFETACGAVWNRSKRQRATWSTCPRIAIRRLRRLPKGDTLSEASDIAIFATPLAFRWVNFGYAIQKGLHVFMEKPVTADGPTSAGCSSKPRRRRPEPQGGRGSMSRHSRASNSCISGSRTAKSATSSRCAAIGWRGRSVRRSRKNAREPSELLWQIQRFHSFVGGRRGLQRL